MTSPLLEAALDYAARGWPVFPCNPKNKQPLLAADKDAAGKAVRGTGGLKKASTDPEQISAWWKKWPHALIGLCTGWPTKGTEDWAHDNRSDTAPSSAGMRLFVLDFDPREDPDSGEIWTLDRLKSETEAQLGCSLPMSLAVLTPSDGVHLYLLQGDDGPPITNRGNLPDHVDVRGLGGYVIAPPSVMAEGAAKGQGGLRYRIHRKAAIARAPEALLAVLRERKGGAPAMLAQAPSPGSASPSPSSPSRGEEQAGDAVRKYALSALDGECQAVRSAGSGKRNAQLNESALKIASLVAAGALEATFARQCIESAARDNPGRDDDRQLLATIDSGWSAGLANPRDLSDLRDRPRHHPSQPSRARSRSASNATAPRSAGQQERPFRNGSERSNSRAPGTVPSLPGPSSPTEAGRVPTEAELQRLQRIAAAWLERRLEANDLTADSLKAVAWGCGRRIAAEHLDEGETREALWKASEGVAGFTLDVLDRAVADGIARGFDPGPTLLDLDCSRLPLTDFGIAERFKLRFGEDFRFTTAKGWLGWDGRRWKVLDQDKDTPPAEIIAAAFETIRALQREAKRVRETDVRLQLVEQGKQQILDLESATDHALDHWVPVGKSWKRFSQLLAEFGRRSEVAGKPAAIAALARRWLTVPIEDFDREQMAVNVLNGTLRFVTREAGGVGGRPPASREIEVRLDPHRREDLVTRLAPVEWDPRAEAPLYDGMIAWALPDPAVRRYAHQVAGYSCSGDTGEHKLWFNYGRGRNGKSTTIDSWCSALGDYSGTIGIESFLDQGIKKRGDAATPDLAKLGGVRMLRASEPERGAKLNSALIKAATGGEPMSVRALHRGFFDLEPRFKLNMSGNSKPDIPDTDEGIWSRMKLIPWLRNIDQPEPGVENWPTKDPKLTGKIKAAELAGVFRRMVEGLVDYLEHGFVEPEGVTLATADYRSQSDPLARFLALCTAREEGSRVKSSELHEVYAAWCKASGEREWSAKGFASALIDKGYTKTRSDGMRWEHLRLTRSVGDFVDAEGKVRLLSDDLSVEPERQHPPPEDRSQSPVLGEDDDLPL